MTKHISIPSIKTTGLHLGSQSGYERLELSYFEKDDSNNHNIIDKSIIISLTYEPDSTYNNTNGYAGTCWVAEMLDSNETTGYIFYCFRNFEDLVEFYREKGYKFIEK
jgi:hypothetical protein